MASEVRHFPMNGLPMTVSDLRQAISDLPDDALVELSINHVHYDTGDLRYVLHNVISDGKALCVMVDVEEMSPEELYGTREEFYGEDK